MVSHRHNKDHPMPCPVSQVNVSYDVKSQPNFVPENTCTTSAYIPSTSSLSACLIIIKPKVFQAKVGLMIANVRRGGP